MDDSHTHVLHTFTSMVGGVNNVPVVSSYNLYTLYRT